MTTAPRHLRTRISLKNVASPLNAPGQRPAAAVHIAEALHNWAMVEAALVNLLATCTGSVMPHGESVTWTEDRLALVVMQSINPLQTRLKILDRALPNCLEAEQIHEWKVIKKTVLASSEARNALAHTVWWISEGHPEALLAPVLGSSISYEIYEPRDLSEIANNIAACHVEVFEFKMRAIECMALRNGTRASSI